MPSECVPVTAGCMCLEMEHSTTSHQPINDTTHTVVPIVNDKVSNGDVDPANVATVCVWSAFVSTALGHVGKPLHTLDKNIAPTEIKMPFGRVQNCEVCNGQSICVVDRHLCACMRRCVSICDLCVFGGGGGGGGGAGSKRKGYGRKRYDAL
jgi:hypothetical protein